MGRHISLAYLRVLRAMLEDPQREHYGLALSRTADVTTGTLYPILVRLEEEGFAESKWEQIDEASEGRRRRRYYVLTGSGAHEAVRLLQAVSLDLAPPKRFWEQSPSPSWIAQ